MAKCKVTFKWRQLYQAKLKDQDEAQKESIERLAQSFKKESARKQSRQIQICGKVPPSSRKRSFGGAFGASSSFSNVKSDIMRKAKVEYSAEMRSRASIKKQHVHVQRINSVVRPQVTREYEIWAVSHIQGFPSRGSVMLYSSTNGATSERGLACHTFLPLLILRLGLNKYPPSEPIGRR